MTDERAAYALRPIGERIAVKVLRSVSRRWLAHTDLFVDPYHRWVSWQSGLGEATRLLYSIARLKRPTTTVEIGSSRGLSTCCLSLACAENKHGHVYAIDPHTQNDWSDVAAGGSTWEFLQGRLRAYALEDHCTPIRKTSQEAAKDWNRPIDLLFIDGDHSYKGVRDDFELFQKWLSADALVLFHDSSWDHFKPYDSYDAAHLYPGEMGVPRYLASLQKDGYMSVTMSPVPGLTIMHPRSGGFDFLQNAVPPK